MSHNTKRAAAMQQKSNQELLDIWMAMSLSSAAAAYVLKQRGIPLIRRRDDGGKVIGRRKLESLGKCNCGRNGC